MDIIVIQILFLKKGFSSLFVPFLCNLPFLSIDSWC